MKKHRRLTAALALMLCASALLSGTLLVFHAEQHSCRFAVCTACTALARTIETYLCALALPAAFALLRRAGGRSGFPPPESRFVPDWTPVRRKVMLLD